MDLKTKVNLVIARFENMTVDELEQEFIKHGYVPIRKTKKQIDRRKIDKENKDNDEMEC